MKLLVPLVAAFLALATLDAARADVSCRAVSGLTTEPLVELYTSEGCSSCPPADAWLHDTFPAARQAPGVAVLAFHVDYWDALGWRDRFAAAAFSARQRDEVAASGGRVVYTPQVLVQGRDVGLFRSAGLLQALDAARQREPGANIEVEVDRRGERLHVSARARLHDASRTARLHVALTESGFRSAVAAGENAGRELAHDHVVRAFGTSSAPAPDGRAALALHITLPSERGRDARLIAFVQDPATGYVLQSVVLPLCGA